MFLKCGFRPAGWLIGTEAPTEVLDIDRPCLLACRDGDAQSQRGSETRNLLMDFGFTGEALNNNLDVLGIDSASLDALVLSHGHYDHFGGVVGFLRKTGGKLKPELPLYIGGEECFCAREWIGPPVSGNFGVLDRRALEQANLTVTYAEGPSLVADDRAR